MLFLLNRSVIGVFSDQILENLQGLLAMLPVSSHDVLCMCLLLKKILHRVLKTTRCIFLIMTWYVCMYVRMWDLERAFTYVYIYIHMEYFSQTPLPSLI